MFASGVLTKNLTSGPGPSEICQKYSTITLTYPYTSPSITLALRAPNLENTEKNFYDRIIRESKGGDQEIFRSPEWPKSKLLTYEVTFNKNQTVNDFLNFVQVSIGQEIGLLDYLNRQWRGLLLVNDEIFRHSGRSNRILNFEFEGDIV